MEELVAVYNKYGRKISMMPKIDRHIFALYKQALCNKYIYVTKSSIGYITIRMYLPDTSANNCILFYLDGMNTKTLLEDGCGILLDRDADYNKIIKDLYGLNRVYNILGIESMLSNVIKYIYDDLEFLMIMKGVSTSLRKSVIDSYPYLKDFVYVKIESHLLLSVISRHKLLAILKRDMYKDADRDNLMPQDVCIFTKGNRILACRVGILTVGGVYNMLLDKYYADAHADSRIWLPKRCIDDYKHPLIMNLYHNTLLYKLNTGPFGIEAAMYSFEHHTKRALSLGKIVCPNGYNSLGEFIVRMGDVRCVFDYLDRYSSGNAIVSNIRKLDPAYLIQIGITPPNYVLSDSEKINYCMRDIIGIIIRELPDRLKTIYMLSLLRD